MSKGTVLVTGGSGFVGSYMVRALLAEGFHVRATVRSLGREAEVRKTLGEPGPALSLVAANLLADEGWDEAAEGVTHVVHVASPMQVGEHRHADVITPARAGTRRVLTAAWRAGVTRVVLTSSTMAALPRTPTAEALDEHAWTDPDAPGVTDYGKAKTLAERDAWELAREHGLELVTILPSMIQGPVLGPDYSASLDVLGFMLRGKMPLVPRLHMSFVDVRDLVDLHLRALLSPAAAGERFVAAAPGGLWLREVAALLRSELGDAARKVPTREAPDWLIRAGAWFNPEARQIAPQLGLAHAFTTAKAERLLGWTPRPARAAILDAARSLVAHGLV